MDGAWTAHGRRMDGAVRRTWIRMVSIGIESSMWSSYLASSAFRAQRSFILYCASTGPSDMAGLFALLHGREEAGAGLTREAERAY